MHLIKILVISLCVNMLAITTSFAEGQYDYAKIIIEQSNKHSYDPFIIMTIVHHESRFNHMAVSKTGAIGLMQIQPTTAKYVMQKTNQEWLGAEELYKPHYNIRVGITYLKYLQSKFSNMHDVFLAYNCGPTKVKQNKIPHTAMRYANSIRRFISFRDLLFDYPKIVFSNLKLQMFIG